MRRKLGENLGIVLVDHTPPTSEDVQYSRPGAVIRYRTQRIRAGRTFACIATLLLVLVIAGCGGSSPTRPTTVTEPSVAPPAPTPPFSVPPLLITCPADLEVQSPDGRAVAVRFTLPGTSGGTAPVSVSCSSAPGAAFEVGTATVACTATDATSATATCRFLVKVLAPPKISLTKFLAFGDSLTLGVVSPARTTLLVAPSTSYPTRLSSLLADRYRTQTLEMINAGVPGEAASEEGVGRLPHELRQYRPQVLLLMEGTNDLYLFPETGVRQATSALQDMIRDARDRGAEVFVATIPPQRPGGPRDKIAKMIPGLNQEIRALARRQGAALVDVFAAFENNLTLIGADDLHPTEAGYEVMAKTFFDAIKMRLELAAGPSTLRPADRALPPSSPASPERP